MTLIEEETILEKTLNKNHESDMNNAVQWTRWFLTFLGIWPRVISNPSKIEKYISIFTLPFCSIVMIMLLVPTVSHIIMRDINRLEVLILLGPIGFHAGNVVKHFVLVLRTNTVKFCVQHMKTDWRRIDDHKERAIMIKNKKIGRGLTIICVIFLYSGCIFYHAIMPLWSGNTINEFNVTIRPLAYPGTDIYIDSQTGINYEIVFCGICIAAFFHFTVVTGIFNLAAVLVTHACGQIQIVIYRISNLVDMEEIGNDYNTVNETIDDRISLIVRWHVRVLRFSTRIDEVLRDICLMEVVGSTVVICLLEYYCMTEWSNGDSVAIITYVLLLFSLSFNIFIYCHIGELLKEQCYEIGRAAYMIEWYKLPGKTGLSLVMIIAMANYPRKLTAGRMIELSITTFGSIMRTSLAYLNMLRTVD